jgi:hypothetical protein
MVFLKGTDVMVYPGGKLVQAVNFFLSFSFSFFLLFGVFACGPNQSVFFFSLGWRIFPPKHNTLLNIQFFNIQN